MKTMLLLSGRANCGKTGTIKLLALQLGLIDQERFDKPTDIARCKEVTIDKKTLYLALSSYGDNAWAVDHGYELLAQNQETGHDFDVIVQATRTGGGSLDTALQYANDHEYDVIQLHTYMKIAPERIYDDANLKSGLTLNQMLAQNIIEIIKNCIE